jgi:alanyl-tRNA synthetase
VLFFGRKDNFWQMAEFGPCGPCSEIHFDLGEERDNLRGQPHKCGVNGECTRYLELWNNVFIQYNLFEDGRLEPLPSKHVDTGMGFERIVSVLQGVDSNYKTDLFQGAMDVLSALTGKSREQMYADFTPYRVIADHARSAAFLIADGVVPGNVGRNYVARMIIRRAARFGTKIGLTEPFLAKVADAIIAEYGDFYPELVQHRQPILDSLTREEIRFARTIESGTNQLLGIVSEMKKQGKRVLDGHTAFDLYATYGLPFEITRDIVREQFLLEKEHDFKLDSENAFSLQSMNDIGVDEAGFKAAREEHSRASGGGKAMGTMGGSDAEFFAGIYKDLLAKGKLGPKGVEYDPYTSTQVEAEVLALVVDGQSVKEAQFGDKVEVILPKTGFYIESGGQVGDTGSIRSLPLHVGGAGGGWEIEISEVRRPASGLISHIGEVVSGKPKIGDKAIAEVDHARRHDIMRNHTATHLMHAALHKVLGEHARQAGSLVDSDHLRFDFNHPDAMSSEQIERVEKLVNEAVAADMEVLPKLKSREDAIAEGAMALFGEKYGDVVRTITITPFSPVLIDEEAAVRPTSAVEQLPKYSYELCGGTHLERTSDVGAFIIVSEGSAAAGVRRIEAVTGRGAYELVAKRFKALKIVAATLKSSVEEVPQKVQTLEEELASARKEISSLRMQLGLAKAEEVFEKNKVQIGDVTVVTAHFGDVDRPTLLAITDKFHQLYNYTGGTIIASGIQDNKPFIYTSSTDSVIKEYGLDSVEIAKFTGVILGGSGGGRPTLGQAGGKDVSKIPEAHEKGKQFIREKIEGKKKSKK